MLEVVLTASLETLFSFSAIPPGVRYNGAMTGKSQSLPEIKFPDLLWALAKILIFIMICKTSPYGYFERYLM